MGFRLCSTSRHASATPHLSLHSTHRSDTPSLSSKPSPTLYINPSIMGASLLPHTLFLSFTPLFHLVGILYRHCQSQVVSEREPGPPRPLSLVQPPVLGAQRARYPPMHRTALMRTSSLPSIGLRFPALLPVDARLLEGWGGDDYKLREFYC